MMPRMPHCARWRWIASPASGRSSARGVAGELRAIARDDERAARDGSGGSANRLRQDLIAAFRLLSTSPAPTWPACNSCASCNAGPRLRIWSEWGARSWSTFARHAQHGWPQRFCRPRAGGPPGRALHPRAYLVRASGTLTACTPRSFWPWAPSARPGNGGLGESGSSRGAPARAGQEGEPRRGGGAVPWRRDLPESFPGLGDRLAARGWPKIGEHVEQFDSPNALQRHAGKASVTLLSGKSELVVATAPGLQTATWPAPSSNGAFCSLSGSGWAREFYDAQIARGKSHHGALRALGNCLARGARALLDARHLMTNRSTRPTVPWALGREGILAPPDPRPDSRRWPPSTPPGSHRPNHEAAPREAITSSWYASDVLS